MALGNIAANEGNHPQLVAKFAIKVLVALSASPHADIREYAGFALANLASNADYLDAIGAKGGIEPLVSLAGSANVHTQVDERLHHFPYREMRNIAGILHDHVTSQCSLAVELHAGYSTSELAISRYLCDRMCLIEINRIVSFSS